MYNLRILIQCKSEQSSSYIHLCSHSWYVCMAGCGSSGGRREMPGIRFGMASNDGSWFAAFRRGTPPGASRVVIYIRYIPGTRLGLLQGFRVTYVATWREKTIFEDISSLPNARWSRTWGRCLFRRERRQISPTERILKSHLNDFHGMRGMGEATGKKQKDCLSYVNNTRRLFYDSVISYLMNRYSPLQLQIQLWDN